jgi:hypothetical protein
MNKLKHLEGLITLKLMQGQRRAFGLSTFQWEVLDADKLIDYLPTTASHQYWA